MEELGMTEGFDVGLEMSGAPPAFRTMLDTMNHGGRIAMLGIPPSDMSIDWNKVIFKGLFIKGIYGRDVRNLVQDGGADPVRSGSVPDHYSPLLHR
jgi:threonine 3-dehydrogenase